MSEINPDLKFFEIASGSACYGWIVPREWKTNEAWLEDPKDRVIADFSKNNLHFMGYSTSVDCCLSLEELHKHLYSSQDKPEAIPYVTSYYRENWGFCISQIE